MNEPCSSAVKPVGEASFEAAVKSLDEPCFAEAPAGEPCPASGLQAETDPVDEEQAETDPVGEEQAEAETDPVGEEQAEEDLKCFEWRTARCEGP